MFIFKNNMTKLLTFTSLYPNAAQPRHGVFVEERLRHVVASGNVMAKVIAPVPWFPFKHAAFGRYAIRASVPKREERYGIQIEHPRYPVIPKVGMGMAPRLMYRALLPVFRRLETQGQDYDLIDAHYFYPDGVAAVLLGRYLGKPVVITARGTDVTLIPQYRIPRRQILWAAEHAAAIMTVSQSLKDSLVTLGIAPHKIIPLRNGVDLERFRPMNQPVIRARLGLTGPVWLSVGHLIERKGLHITISALAQVPDITLLIVGDGPEERHLRQLANILGVSGRIRFLGAISHTDLCEYYNAANVVILASSREGMPNVVLEALACGTRVIATAVDGTPELITSPDAGELMQERTPEALIAAWYRLRTVITDRISTRKFAQGFGWLPIVEAQQALYANVLSKPGQFQVRK